MKTFAIEQNSKRHEFASELLFLPKKLSSFFVSTYLYCFNFYTIFIVRTVAVPLPLNDFPTICTQEGACEAVDYEVESSSSSEEENEDEQEIIKKQQALYEKDRVSIASVLHMLFILYQVRAAIFVLESIYRTFEIRFVFTRNM